MKIPALILAGITTFAAGAHATPEVEPAMAAAYTQSIQSLASSADPRDWILAVALSSGPASRTAETAATYARATAAAPGDVLVQWLAAMREDEVAIAALTRLEPDNAVSWLPALRSAFQHHDEAAIDAALAGFAASTRVDDHHGQLLHAWQAAFQRQPDTGLCESARPCDRTEHDFTLAMAMTTASVFPAYAPIVHFCKATPADSLRHAQCEAGARRMFEDSGTLVSSAVGFVLLRGLDALTPADEELRRQRDWLQDVTMPLHRDFGPDAPGFAEFVADWSTQDSEIEVMRRQAQRAGLSLTPPDGWISPGQRAREAEQARGAP